MQKYYFAGTCFTVFGDNEFLSSSRLSLFLNECSYNNQYELSILFDYFPEYKNVRNVTKCFGISVNDINGEKWLFSSTDEVNYCCIEATRDCSKLKCYIGLSKSSNKSAIFENFIQLIRTATECYLAYCSRIALHASFISYKQKAVLFTAPSGTGKSTQAEIWKTYFGAKIINGDRPVLHSSPDEVRAYGVPWDGKEQIFLQENYPVTAIVEVRQAKENRLRKMNEDQAFKLMMNQCFIPMWDDAAKFSVMKTIKFIVKRIPFYRLFCMPNKNAADLLREELFIKQNTVSEEEQHDMKVKDGFILKNIVDEFIVMPTGNNIRNFEGAIVLNETSAFIWNQLKNFVSRDDLLKSVLDEFDIDEETATADLDALLDKLRGLDIIQEDSKVIA